MSKCTECGESNSLLHKCSLCDLRYCEGHRLPESHECPGLKKFQDSTRWFENKDKEPVGEKSDISDRHAVNQPEDVTSLVWQCQDCGEEYATNQKDCARCDSRVFEPIQVSIEEKRERLPETKFNRENQKKANQDANATNEKKGLVDIDVYEFEKPLLMRIKKFVLNGSHTNPFENIRSDIFVWDYEDDEIIRRFKRVGSQDGSGKFLVEKYSTSMHGDAIHIAKEGSRVYDSSELKSRFTFKLSLVAEYSWNQANDVLFT